MESVGAPIRRYSSPYKQDLRVHSLLQFLSSKHFVDMYVFTA